jgi:Zn finger protein HypA/HybF involved in hydrogenase expression
MESLVELPIYIKCVCKDCGHKWEPDALSKSCPECNSSSIDCITMMRGL